VSQHMSRGAQVHLFDYPRCREEEKKE